MSSDERIRKYFIADNGTFPNSHLPVLHYPKALRLPFLFPAHYARNIFKKNGWTNNWRNGIYTFMHYHSNTHEAMAVIHGATSLLLGGDAGKQVTVGKGDVIILPAGVAHKNLGNEKDVICIGGYPEGRDFDMNYGKPGERPDADNNIRMAPFPVADPVFGQGGLRVEWTRE